MCGARRECVDMACVDMFVVDGISGDDGELSGFEKGFSYVLRVDREMMRPINECGLSREGQGR